MIMDTRSRVREVVENAHYIGGSWQGSSSGSVADSINPATGKRLGTFADGTIADAKAAIDAAASAFETGSWAQSPRLRQDVLMEWARRLSDRRSEIAQLLTAENGKILAQAEGEVAAAISEIKYYAGLARNVSGRVVEPEPGVLATVTREPAGVTGIIVPWNGPVLLLIRSLAPALAAGCTCIVKPAAQTTLVTIDVIAELASCAGLEPGVVNLVTEAGHAVSAELVASEKVDVISFTGSSETGQKIMAAAAPTMKKLSLELGGKSCCLVFDDVDVDVIAPKLAAAATIISGQQCTAARRILVHASKAAAMKKALAAALSGIVVGSGDNPSSGMGPLIDVNARDKVRSRIADAMDAADEVLLAPCNLDELRAGSFLAPALIAHSDPNSFFSQEEIFGPLVVIETFQTEREAVEKANNTVFGLSASVWTHDGARSLRIARALRNGTVWINDHNKLFAEAEMGGYRRSGLGRLHGPDALIDFTEQKHIYQNVGTIA
jgi:betaine-aldehyde dehydrogenase